MLKSVSWWLFRINENPEDETIELPWEDYNEV